MSDHKVGPAKMVAYDDNGSGVAGELSINEGGVENRDITSSRSQGGAVVLGGVNLRHNRGARRQGIHHVWVPDSLYSNYVTFPF